MILEKTICKDIAINFCKKGDFDLAIPYFERCFKPIELPNTVTIRSDKEMIQSYYYYCYYALKFKKIENSEILKSINKAMAMNHDPELADKLAFIKRKISKNGDDSLEYGEIIFYNWRLKYGLINSNNKTLIFFLNNFQKQLNQEEISSLSERKVSFIKRISPKDKEKYVADKISLLD